MRLESGIQKLKLSMSAACVALAMTCGIAGAAEVPLVDGTHWVGSSPEAKKAFLIGMANIVQVETAYQTENAPHANKSFSPQVTKGSPQVTKGMHGQTLASVQEALDQWYAANPDKLQRPVVETIWFEMVLPGLKTSK